MATAAATTKYQASADHIMNRVGIGRDLNTQPIHQVAFKPMPSEAQGDVVLITHEKPLKLDNPNTPVVVAEASPFSCTQEGSLPEICNYLGVADLSVLRTNAAGAKAEMSVAPLAVGMG